MATLIACWFFKSPIADRFSPNGWQAGNLYGAVFDWASIQSGFVFAIYGFIVTKKDGFIGAITPAQSYEQFIGYTRRACLGGFALTLSSLPLLVISPAISAQNTVEFWIVASWFAFFIWAFGAFLRVAFSFGIMVAVPDRKERIPD
jgi:hypothetical protein